MQSNYKQQNQKTQTAAITVHRLQSSFFQCQLKLQQIYVSNFSLRCMWVGFFFLVAPHQTFTFLTIKIEEKKFSKKGGQLNTFTNAKFMKKQCLATRG